MMRGVLSRNTLFVSSPFTLYTSEGHWNESLYPMTISPSVPVNLRQLAKPNNGTVEECQVTPPSMVCNSSVSVGTCLRFDARSGSIQAGTEPRNPSSRRGGCDPPIM